MLSVRENHFCLGLSKEVMTRSFQHEEQFHDVSCEGQLLLHSSHSLSREQDSDPSQLFVLNKRLVWSASTRERMVIESEKCIVDANICSFVEDPKGGEFLCVADTSSLAFYALDGDVHEHMVPHAVVKLWCTPAGLLIQAVEGKPAQLVQHPIAGPQPVQTTGLGGVPAGEHRAWEDQQVLFADAATPVAVTCNYAKDEVRFWCLKSYPAGARSLPRSTHHRSQPVHMAAGTPGTPASDLPPHMRIRTPEGHIQPFIFSAFRSSHLMTGNTTNVFTPAQQRSVKLPPEEVLMAYDLTLCEALDRCAAVQVVRVQELDASDLLAVLDSAGNISVYVVNATSGSTAKKTCVTGNYTAIVAVQCSGAALIGCEDTRLSLLALDQSGTMWLFCGSERLMPLALPEDTELTADQVMHFPQPGGRATAGDLDSSSSMITSPHAAQPPEAADVFPPEATDSCFRLKRDAADEPESDVADNATRQTRPLRDLGRIVYLSHASGRTFLVHFEAGVNVQAIVPHASCSELVSKCFLALRSVMPPPNFHQLLTELNRSCSLCDCEERDWATVQSFLLNFWRRHLASAVLEDPAPLLRRISAAAAPRQPESAFDKLMMEQEVRQLLGERTYPAFADTLDEGTDHREGSLPAEASVPALSGSGRALVADMLGALHSVFQDLTLHQACWRHMPKLAALMLHLCSHVSATHWRDYYRQHLISALHTHLIQPECAREPVLVLQPPLDAPPDLLSALQNKISGLSISSGEGPYPLLVQQRSAAVQRSLDICGIYQALGGVVQECARLTLRGASATSLAAAHQRGSVEVLHLLDQLRWTLVDLDGLPFGVAQPIQEALHVLQEDPPSGLTTNEYILIGREDLAATSLSLAEAPQEDREEQQEPVVKHRYAATLTSPLSPVSLNKNFLTPRLDAGLSGRTGRSASYGGKHAVSSAGVPLQAAKPTSLLTEWNSQYCLGHANAQRLGLPGFQLSSMKTLDGPTRATDDISGSKGQQQDPSLQDLSAPFYRMRFGRDLRLTEALKLMSFSRYVLLRSSGDPDAATQSQAKLLLHAARTLALPIGRGALTLASVNMLPTEPLTVHNFVLSGRLPNHNHATVALDMSALGVAPRVGAENELTAWPEFHAGACAALRVVPSASNLIRTWILFKKPPEPTYSHAGVLLALGFTGELRALSVLKQLRYLCQEHDAIIVSLLLGLAASYRGTMDNMVNRTLSMHIPACHLSMYGEIELSPLTQATAMAGLGLLFEGSGHQDTSELLLQQIALRPEDTSTHAGSGGGGGNTATDQQTSIITHDRETFALSAGFALGLINIGRGHWSSGVSNGTIVESLKRLIMGGAWVPNASSNRRHAGFSAGASSSWHPSSLWQADMPAAKLPGDDSAPSHGLSQVVLEGSLVNLDVTSPAAMLALTLMFLKTNDATIASMLTLPETTFALESVRPFFILLRVLAHALIMWDSVEPSTTWVMAQLPAVIRKRWPEHLEAIKQTLADGKEYDHEAVLLAHIHAVTGACLALGLRYAGTAVEEARATVEEMLLYLMRCRATLVEIRALVSGFAVDTIVVERMVAICAMSLGAIMSGMGDLKTFKLLRALRKRLNVTDTAPSANVASSPLTNGSYGVHMAIGMSIGFLFLGGSCHTFDTSNKSVAMLLISMWPALPSSPNDNRCHMQAFRHLYVLASNQRIMRAIDVHMRHPVYVPVTLYVESNSDEGAPDKPRKPLYGENLPANVLRSEDDVMKGGAMSPISRASVDAFAMEESTPDMPVMAVAQGMHRGAPATQVLGLDGLPSGGHTPAGLVLNTSTAETERLCPCLMLEPSLLRAVKVGGGRYWAQHINAHSHGYALQALCDRAALFVKKRAHALSYQDDPTGVRSLLATLFQPSSIRTASEEPGHDLLHMCSTFSSDPFVTNFALAFCLGDASDVQRACEGGMWSLPSVAFQGSEGRGGGGGGGGGAEVKAPHEFLCRTLSECVMNETTHVLPQHLQIFFVFQALGCTAELLMKPATPAARPAHFISARQARAATPSRRMSSRLRATAEPDPPAPADAEETDQHSVLPNAPALGNIVLTPREESEANVPRLSASPPAPQTHTFGWGMSKVMSAAGLNMTLRNVSMSLAHARGPLAAAAASGPDSAAAPQTSQRSKILPSEFLLLCLYHLEQVLRLLSVTREVSILAGRSAPDSSAQAQETEQLRRLCRLPKPGMLLSSDSSLVREAARQGIHACCEKISALVPEFSGADRGFALSLLGCALQYHNIRSISDAAATVQTVLSGLPAAPDMPADLVHTILSGASGLAQAMVSEIV